MADQPTLGPVVFSGFEIPQKIVLGGKQRLVVHTMPGGRRVVDAMGPEEDVIQWSGIFSGSAAADRVRTLDRLRQSGDVLLFTWNSWRYHVVIQSFDTDVAAASWVPYQIGLCVVDDPNAGASDWLATAVGPALVIAAVGATVLETQIATAGAALVGNSLAGTVAAAGLLAQSVTARALNGITS